VSRLEYLVLQSDHSTTFQSRAGFSECLDLNIVASEVGEARFQSRAGFSECLDALRADGMVSSKALFQSRAGFSECLDLF